MCIAFHAHIRVHVCKDAQVHKCTHSGAAKVESLARSASIEQLQSSPKRRKVAAGNGHVDSAPHEPKLALQGKGTRRPAPRVILTTHPSSYSVDPIQILWGHSNPVKRGPVVASLLQPEVRARIVA